MCGRFSLSKSNQDVADLFRLKDVPGLQASYNIAPMQPVAAVLVMPGSCQWQLRHLVWGLVPPWADDPAKANRLINARSETAATKPTFRAAFRYRRCLIPADGFYEWQKLGQRKQPHFISLRDHALFAFAGLWEHWESADGGELDSCAILTTEPNALCAEIHNRMPVLLSPDAYDPWLDPDNQTEAALKSLLAPFPPEKMTAHTVSTHVNNPRNNDPKCAEPLQDDNKLWPPEAAPPASRL